ncbi:MAG: K+ channel, inward rectifier, partial [Bacteroidota bacterium]|nr:K+ channel, inward rectifier [Bacteroidota bacterium]
RPTAKVIYSQNALIAPYRGFSALMFRAVNGGRSRLIEIQADVTMARTEKIENLQQRRFYRLKLEISSISVLPTSWTIVHPIDEESPMAGRLQQEINDEDTEVLVMLKAFDETYSQTVYSRTSYKYHQIVHGGKFLPMVEDDPDGVIVLDMDKLDSYQNVTLPPNSN